MFLSHNFTLSPASAGRCAAWECTFSVKERSPLKHLARDAEGTAGSEAVPGNAEAEPQAVARIQSPGGQGWGLGPQDG